MGTYGSRAQWLTFALAFLQFVHALRVRDSGGRLRLKELLLASPSLLPLLLVFKSELVLSEVD